LNCMQILSSDEAWVVQAERYLPQLALNSLDGIADLLDELCKAFLRNIKSLGPIAHLVILLHADAATVLWAAIG